MPEVGLPELLIIGLVLAVVFGPGKLGDLGGALGRSVGGFRRAVREEDDEGPNAPSADQTGAADMVRRCARCDAQLNEGDKFCINCGAPLGAVGIS